MGVHAGVFISLPLADRRGGGLAVDARGNAVAVVVMVVVTVAVRGATICARPAVLPQVRIAALLGPTPVSLSVLEAPRKIDHEARGSGAAGSAEGFPPGPAVFPKGCNWWWREDGVFLEAARSGPHL